MKLNEATAEDSDEDLYNSSEDQDIFTDSIEKARRSQDTVYCKKLPKHVKEIFFDDDL